VAGAMTAVGRLGGLEKLAPAEDGRFLALAASGLPHRPTRADEPVAAVGECCRRVWNTGVAPASAPLPPVHRTKWCETDAGQVGIGTGHLVAVSHWTVACWDGNYQARRN